ncbi:hypothetical protein BC833DRAFT_54517 [Globomyces pollinis-pini]|nr:hypothetical protein BC833DRAFT_54517 [Globomyces pollinis-pini]
MFMLELESLSDSVTNHTLFVSRVSTTIFFVSWILWRLATEGWRYLFFLTNWNWILNSVYFAISSLYCYSVIHQSKMRHILKSIHIIMFAVVMTISWIVAFGFWTLLSKSVVDPNRLVTERMISALAHILNLIFPIFDLFLCKTTLEYYQVVYPIIALLMYMVLTLWPYPFMKSLNGGEAGINWAPMVGLGLGVVVAGVLFYILALSLIRLRQHVNKSKRMDPKLPMTQAIF